MLLDRLFLPFAEGYDPPIYFSSDPVIKEAKKTLAAFVEQAPRESELLKYQAARRLVVADYLSRCTFELDGEHYQVTNPRLNLNGTVLRAHELIADPRICTHLVHSGSGSIKPIPSPLI